jgi:hypothetical protein
VLARVEKLPIHLTTDTEEAARPRSLGSRLTRAALTATTHLAGQMGSRASVRGLGDADPAAGTDEAGRVAVRNSDAAAAGRPQGLVVRSAPGGNAEAALRKLIDLPGSARIRCIGREQSVGAVRHEQELIAAGGGTGLHWAGERCEQRDGCG